MTQGLAYFGMLCVVFFVFDVPSISDLLATFRFCYHCFTISVLCAHLRASAPTGKPGGVMSCRSSCPMSVNNYGVVLQNLERLLWQDGGMSAKSPKTQKQLMANIWGRYLLAFVVCLLLLPFVGYYFFMALMAIIHPELAPKFFNHQ